MDNNELAKQNQPSNNETNKKGINRRKALELAAVGLAGVIVSNVAKGQSIEEGGKSPVKSATPIQDFTKESLPKRKQISNFLEDNNDKIPFERNLKQKEIWNKLSESITTLMSITDNNELTGKFSSTFLRIESEFNFTAQELDEELLPTHIEPLIDQAADLLDRCLKDRATWDELSIRLFNLAIELHEYKELDKIHLEEEKAGVYDLPYIQSSSDYNAESMNFESIASIADRISWLINTNFSLDNINELSKARQFSAWLAGTVPYTWEGQHFNGYLTYKNFEDVSKDVSSHYQDCAAKLSLHELWIQKLTFDLQKVYYENQKEISFKKLRGLSAKSAWDKQNANFLRRRTIVSRTLQDVKTKAAIDEDGILNYAKRLVPLKIRFDKDFRDALARMKAVEKGLKAIYGFEFPIPTDEKSISYYDDCLIWTRQVIQWILKFTRKEQNTIYPISLVSILGKSQFKTMGISGEWKFNLGESNLPNMCNLRLRGISVSVVDNMSFKDRIWQFQIAAPKKTQIRHYLNNEIIDFDQSFLEPCVLGRVVERESTKIPDIVGLTSLYNASPLGEWAVKALGALSSNPCDKIDDIIIDLHLAYRWKMKTKGGNENGSFGK